MKSPFTHLGGKRSTASLVISTGALFVALSGGAVAAVVIPDNSVGNAQLRNGSVSHSKIAEGAVSAESIDSNQVQRRVNGKCAPLSAVTSVNSNGSVGCYRAISASVVTPGTTQTVADPGNRSLIATDPLPTPAAYVVQANPQISVSGTTTTNEQVVVSCELSASDSTPQTETSTINLGPGTTQGTANMNLMINVPAESTENGAAVACTANHNGTVAPTVTVASGITALQTLHNTAYYSQNSTTAPLTVGTPTVPTATTATTTTP